MPASLVFRQMIRATGPSPVRAPLSAWKCSRVRGDAGPAFRVLPASQRLLGHTAAGERLGLVAIGLRGERGARCRGGGAQRRAYRTQADILGARAPAGRPVSYLSSRWLHLRLL